MKEELEKAIKATASKAAETKQPHEAMQFAQAALNMAHALITVTNIK